MTLQDRLAYGVTAALAALLIAPLGAQLPQPSSPWQPPAGIPSPSFGIDEQPGAITHYVDNSSAAATDSSNPNGSATRPRLTVPTVLPAGSVVEVHGGPYNLTSSTTAWSAQGTASAPVFIKGVGSPIFAGSGGNIAMAGSYFIVDGLVFQNLPLRMAPTLHHFAVRRSLLRNHSPGSNSSAVSPAGSDIVVFANEIANNGDPNSTVEVDVHGVKPDTGANRVWIVDNNIHHNGGDAVQVGSSQAAEPWAQSIYIGRNTLHEDRENGVDIKRARDVIVSENVVYGYVARSSSAGEAIVTHDNPQRIWVIGNRVGYSTQGIVCTGADGYFVLDNIIGNIVHTAGDPAYDPNNLFRTAGILTYGTTNSYHINNTLWNVDAGISYASGATKTEIVNNIISNLLQPSYHIGFGSSTSLALSVVSNNLLQGTPRIRVSGSVNSCAGFTACIVGDPLLRDPAQGQFDLEPGSPAIDKGMAHPVYSTFQQTYGFPIATDAAGRLRPQGTAMDIGAIEFQNGAPAPPTNLRIIR